MSNLQLEKLQTALLSRGYSRSYVKGLVDELHDHFESALSHSAMSSADAVEQHRISQQRLGSVETIIESVMAQPDLVPLPQRRPCLTFVIVPGLVLGLVMVSAIWAAEALAAFAGDMPHPGKRALADGFACLGVLTSLLMVGAIFAVAIRYRVHVAFPLISAALISLTGCFKIELVTCKLSSQILSVQQWDFDGWRVLAPMIFAATVSLFVMSPVQRLWRRTTNQPEPVTVA